MTLYQEIKKVLAFIDSDDCASIDEVVGALTVALDRHPETWSAEVPTEPGLYPVLYSRDSKMWVLDFTENIPAADWAAKIGLPGLRFGPRVEFPPLPDKEATA